MNTSCLVQSKGSSKGFTLTLHETRCVHDSMNRPKMNLLLIHVFIFYIISQVSISGFPNIWILSDILTEVLGIAK